MSATYHTRSKENTSENVITCFKIQPQQCVFFRFDVSIFLFSVT